MLWSKTIPRREQRPLKSTVFTRDPAGSPVEVAQGKAYIHRAGLWAASPRTRRRAMRWDDSSGIEVRDSTGAGLPACGLRVSELALSEVGLWEALSERFPLPSVLGINCSVAEEN